MIRHSPEERELIEKISALCAEAQRLKDNGQDHTSVMSALADALAKYEDFRLMKQNAEKAQHNLGFPRRFK